MQWKDEKQANVLILTVNGRLDSSSSKQFEDHIMSFIAKGEKSILIDMAGIDYISSAGLRALLTVNRKITSENGKLVLSGLTAPVKEVFDIASFTPLFSIASSQQEALTQFS